MDTIKIHKPATAQNYCVTDVFKPDVFQKYGIEVVATPEEADVIIASWLQELQGVIHRFGTAKRYMLWNPEPLWMAMEKSNAFSPRIYVMEESVAQTIPIEVMSFATRDIFPDNYFFLQSKPEEVERVLAEKPLFDGSNRKVVAVVTYRNAPQFAYHFNDSFYSLNNESNLDVTAPFVQDMLGWDRVIQGQRNLGQQTVEFSLIGYSSYEAALQALKIRLPKMVLLSK